MGNSIDCEQCNQTDDYHQNRTVSNLTMKNQRQKIEANPMKASLTNLLEKDVGILKQKDEYFKVVYGEGKWYHGQMFNNMRHGHGIQYFGDGLQYNGMWQFDKGKGYGILKTNDFQLQGEFENNIIVKGKMKTINGKFTEIYQGSFKDFKYHGIGVLNIVGHSIYQGEFVENKKNGKGKITYDSGTSYEGDFLNGNIEGFGTYKNKQFQYQGQFKMNKINGKGTCRWKNGNIYIGQFANGLRQGKGDFFNGSTTIYNGLWRKGKPYDPSYTFGKKNEPKAKVYY